MVLKTLVYIRNDTNPMPLVAVLQQNLKTGLYPTSLPGIEQ